MVKAVVRWAGKDSRATGKEIAVVVDVLRASSVITKTLAYGAEWVMCTENVRQARKLAARHEALLIGERNCLKIYGFDFGNSLSELNREKIENEKIIFTSTNFPKALAAGENAGTVLVGSILNVGPITELACQLALSKQWNICFMLAGTRGKFSVEDFVFVGAAAETLKKYKVLLSDDIKEAMGLVSRDGLRKCIETSSRAKRLVRLGFHDDVVLACKRDEYSVRPVLKDKKIVEFS